MHYFDATITIESIEIADKIAKTLVLPFEFMDAEIAISITYNYIPYAPGTWNEPSEPEEVEIEEVSIVSISPFTIADASYGPYEYAYAFILNLNERQKEKIADIICDTMADRIEALCFEDVTEGQRDFDPPFDYEDYI